jgi:hypothetical protein
LDSSQFLDGGAESATGLIQVLVGAVTSSTLPVLCTQMNLLSVMAGLVPAIHAFFVLFPAASADRDAR